MVRQLSQDNVQGAVSKCDRVCEVGYEVNTQSVYTTGTSQNSRESEK